MNHIFFWSRIQSVSMARLLAMISIISHFCNGSARPNRCGIEDFWLYNCLQKSMARIFTLMVRILAVETP